MDLVAHSTDFCTERKGMFMFQYLDWTKLEIQETASYKSKQDLVKAPGLL